MRDFLPLNERARAAGKVAVFLVLAGMAGLWWAGFRNGDAWLDRVSFDLGQRALPERACTNAIILEIDDYTLQKLDRDRDERVDHEFHIQVLDRLEQAGAGLVFLDMVLSRADPAEEIDRRLVERIRRHGRVLSGAYFAEPTRLSHAVVTREIRPFPLMETNTPWGYLNFHRDTDDAVRRLEARVPEGVSSPEATSAVWLALQRFDASLAKRRGAPGDERWLHYYGPAHKGFVTRAYVDVLQSPATDDAFRGRLVFVGKRTKADTVAADSDLARNPRGGLSAGVEVIATSVVNLVRGDFLLRVAGPWQLVLITGWGLILAALGFGLPAGRARGAIGAAALALAAGSILLPRLSGWWWTWAIPVLGQAPLALAAVRWLPARPVVFISYRSEDGEEVARALQQTLTARGHPAFLAPGSIAPGAPFPSALARSIAEAPSFLFVLTPAARIALTEPDSWVAREIRQALRLGRRPLIVRSATPPLERDRLPDDLKPLADVNDVEYQSGRYFEPMMEEIVRGLEHVS